MTEFWNLLPSTVPSVLALLIIILAIMVLTYLTKEMLIQTQLVKARVLASLPITAGGLKGPFAKLWEAASSYLESPFHYLRKGVFGFIILFGLMIFAKTHGYIGAASTLAVVEFAILVSLALRWQWFGLAAILGGLTAVLEETDTNHPDVTKAILDGVKAFGTVLGYTLIVALVLSVAILVIPWETSPNLTFAFFFGLFLIVVAMTYSIVRGFKTYLIRDIAVFGGVALGFYAIAKSIWPTEVASITGSGVGLLGWNPEILVRTILITTALALLTVGIWLLSRRHVLTQTDTGRMFRRLGAGSAVVGLLLLLGAIAIPNPFSATKTEMVNKAPTTKEVGPAEKLVAEKLKAHYKKKNAAKSTKSDGDIPTIRGGEIVFKKMGEQKSFYIEGTVLLINEVPCSALLVLQSEAFIMTSTPDGTTSTITPKSGHRERVAISVRPDNRRCGGGYNHDAHGSEEFEAELHFTFNED